MLKERRDRVDATSKELELDNLRFSSTICVS
jgi:hypothetical protein